MKNNKIISVIIISMMLMQCISPLVFAIGDDDNTYISFDNKTLEQEIINQGIDTNGDKKISTEEAKNVNGISLTSNCTTFNELTNFANLSDFRIGTIYDTEQKIDFQNLIDNLKQLKLTNINIQSYFDMGNIELNSDGIINLSSISPIISALNDKNSYLYNEDFNFKVDTDYDDSNNENLTTKFNKENYTISIDTSKSGDFYTILTVENNSGTLYFSFKIKWRVMNTKDNTEEINFADNNLKNYILANNDFNNDGKITKYDMEQIISLDIMSSSDITSLEGLQFATNLENLNIKVKNENSDISQLSKLNNLMTLNIINGDLKDYAKNLLKLKSITCQYGILDINNLNVALGSLSYYGYNINNAENIGNLSNLSYVSIDNYNNNLQINYDFIENLTNLSYFTVSDNNGSIDMKKFNNLKEIYAIQLTGLKISNLNDLNIKNNNLIIGLSECNITSIEFVKNFTGFYSLFLTNNNITDISPLNGIKMSGADINLKGNPIDDKIESNAATIEYFKNNNITYHIDDYSASEEVKFADENLKKVLINSTSPKYDTNNDGKISKSEIANVNMLFLNSDIKNISGLEYATNLKHLSLNAKYNEIDNLDFTPISNLKKLEEISLYGEFSNMVGFEFIKNLDSLNKINVYNYPHKFDFNGIENNTNLTSIVININQYDGVEKQLLNVEKIEKLSNLNSLEVSINKGTIYADEISKLSNLNTLKLNGKIDNIQKIFSMSNLNDLELNNFNSNNSKYDLSGIGNLTKLNTFEYTGRITDITNISELNKIDNLQKIIINISGYINNYESRINAYKDYMIKEQEFVNTIESLKCNQIKVTPVSSSYLGEMQLGKEKTMKFADISPLIKDITTEGSKLYNSNLEISKNNSTNNSFVTVDTQNKTITIKSNNEIGEQSAYINVLNGSISLLWNNITQGDINKKITIPDENLKKCLLDKYDIDGDNEITENDIINITKLDIRNQNISSLEGLQYAKNLKYIYASNNKITDVTPLVSIYDNLELCTLNNNLIEDITPLKNYVPNEKNDYAPIYYIIDMGENYIDISDGTANRETFDYQTKLSKEKGYEYTDNNEWYYTHKMKYGSLTERDDILNIKDNLKQRLIDNKADENNDGSISKGELNDLCSGKNQNDRNLDLSGLELEDSDIDCLKYLTNIETLNLSNNNIQNASVLKYIGNLYNVDLSHNKIDMKYITDICTSIYNINLSYNNISDISNIDKIFTKVMELGAGDAGCIDSFNLSHNNISDLSVFKNTFELGNIENLDLSYNNIEDISNLSEVRLNNKNYSDDIKRDDTKGYGITKIDLSNNYIKLDSESSKNILSIFKNNNIEYDVNNQKIKVEKKDENTGIKIEMTTEIVPENVVLNINKLDTTSDTNKNLIEIIDTIPNKKTDTKYQIFDIKLLNENSEQVEPNGNVTVYLPIPEGYNDKVKVYNVDSNNIQNPYTLLDTTIVSINNQKYIKFITNHFSYYSMVNGALQGDINGDGKVNITDVALINSYVKKVSSLTEEQLSSADINGDGKVNITDVALINAHVKKVKLLW